jgi:hypothetical protein
MYFFSKATIDSRNILLELPMVTVVRKTCRVRPSIDGLAQRKSVAAVWYVSVAPNS